MPATGVHKIAHLKKWSAPRKSIGEDQPVHVPDSEVEDRASSRHLALSISLIEGGISPLFELQQHHCGRWEESPTTKIRLKGKEWWLSVSYGFRVVVVVVVVVNGGDDDLFHVHLSVVSCWGCTSPFSWSGSTIHFSTAGVSATATAARTGRAALANAKNVALKAANCSSSSSSNKG